MLIHNAVDTGKASTKPNIANTGSQMCLLITLQVNCQMVIWRFAATAGLLDEELFEVITSHLRFHNKEFLQR